MNNTKVLKVYNRKLITGRWSEFSYYIKNKISKIHYKLLSLFIDLENSKEYDPGDLGIHNHRMIVDNWYKFAYYVKCIMYRLRYKFLSFLVDVILTILMLIFFILLCLVVGSITFVAMTILVNPKSFSHYG
jgi:hypothetical protein